MKNTTSQKIYLEAPGEKSLQHYLSSVTYILSTFSFI